MNSFVNPRNWDDIGEERLDWLAAKERKYREKRSALLSSLRETEAAGGDASEYSEALQCLEQKKATWMVKLYKERVEVLREKGKSVKQAADHLSRWQSRV